MGVVAGTGPEVTAARPQAKQTGLAVVLLAPQTQSQVRAGIPLHRRVRPPTREPCAERLLGNGSVG